MTVNSPNTSGITIEERAGVRTILLDRPQKRNAFDGTMLTALADALAAAEAADTVRVVVIASRGPVFCAGADLKWMAQQAAGGADANLAGARRMGGIFHAVSACKKPVVARVQGATMGGGVGLASACDIVVASPNAWFALSEVRLGLVPAVISPFVVRRVGPAKGRALFMLGGRVPAAEAHRIGLVDVLCDRDDASDSALDAAVAATVKQLVAGAPGAQYACKTLVDGIAWRDPADVLDFTAAAIAEQRATAEASEGIAAFLGKRPASWIPQASEDGEASAT